MLARHPWRRHARRYFTVLATGAVVALLAACGSSNDSGSASSGSTTPKGNDFSGETLTVINYGGSWQENWNKAITKGFEQKYNVKVREVEATGTQVVAKMRAQRNNPQIDVWMGNPTLGAQLTNEKMVNPLDPAKIPNMANVYPQFRIKGDPYVTVDSGPVGIVYNKKKIKTPPTSYADLYKPEYKGHVVMPSTDTCCSYYFPIIQSYLNGGDLNNMKPGWDALKRLKPNVLTFTGWQQLVSLMSSGQGWIAFAGTDRVGTAIKEGAPLGVVLPEEGNLPIPDVIGVTKGTKHQRLAELYINAVLGGQGQKEFTSWAVLSPVVKDAQVDPANLPFLGSPEYGEKTAKAMPMDWNVVLKNDSAWLEEFTKVVGG